MSLASEATMGSARRLHDDFGAPEHLGNRGVGGMEAVGHALLARQGADAETIPAETKVDLKAA
jgi:hypothetical protein